MLRTVKRRTEEQSRPERAEAWVPLQQGDAMPKRRPVESLMAERRFLEHRRERYGRGRVVEWEVSGAGGWGAGWPSGRPPLDWVALL